MTVETANHCTIVMELTLQQPVTGSPQPRIGC